MNAMACKILHGGGVFLFIKLEVQLFSANVLCHSFMCFSREHAWNSRQDVLKVINNFDDQTACITSKSPLL